MFFCYPVPPYSFLHSLLLYTHYTLRWKLGRRIWKTAETKLDAMFCSLLRASFGNRNNKRFLLPVTGTDNWYITLVLIDDAMSLVPEFEFGIQPMLGAEKAQLICIYHNTHFPTVPSMTRVYLGRGKTRHMLCRQPTINISIAHSINIGPRHQVSVLL